MARVGKSPLSTLSKARGRKHLKLPMTTPSATVRQARLAAARRARLLARTGKPSPSIVIDAVERPGRPMRSLRFGAVTVSNTEPDEAVVVANVKAGRDALVRAVEALFQPGVTPQVRLNVPRFRVDAREPGVLIREINGRVERGTLVHGDFVPAG